MCWSDSLKSATRQTGELNGIALRGTEMRLSELPAGGPLNQQDSRPTAGSASDTKRATVKIVPNAIIRMPACDSQTPACSPGLCGSPVMNREEEEERAQSDEAEEQLSQPPASRAPKRPSAKHPVRLESHWFGRGLGDAPESPSARVREYK